MPLRFKRGSVRHPGANRRGFNAGRKELRGNLFPKIGVRRADLVGCRPRAGKLVVLGPSQPVPTAGGTSGRCADVLLYDVARADHWHIPSLTIAVNAIRWSPYPPGRANASPPGLPALPGSG